MATDKLGLYVHIPYCVRKCSYCDFCSLPTPTRCVPDGYVARLADEIRGYRSFGRPKLSTVYFGGGTPSLLSPDQLCKIVSAIREIFTVCDGAEITFEANPGTLSEEKARAFKDEGFNRVSLGLQSIHEKEMKTLGRIHNFDDFVRSFSILREVGFDNVNVDLMYGIPHQTTESFLETMSCVASFSPEHISAYGLIIEEGTPFYNERHALPIPDADTESDMYALCCETLASLGYSHYEISNYARAGYESEHNLLYWRMKDYIGVGASAHSFYLGRRYSNTDCISEYISSTGIGFSTADTLDTADARYEYAMLALRLSEGLSLSEYSERFGVSFTEGKEELIERFCREGLMRLDNGRLSITESGFYVSNSILVEIL